MNTATQAPTTEAFDSFARTVSAETVDRSDVVSKFSELATSETLDALRLTFDNLVKTLQTEGVTPRSAALISALEANSRKFMSESHAVRGWQRNLGYGFENGAYEGICGRTTARGFVPYTAEELVSVLVANLHGRGGGTAVATKEFAASVTANFTRIRSDGGIVIRPAM